MPRPTRPRANSHRQTGSISSTGVNPSHSYNNSFNLNDSFESSFGASTTIPQLSEVPMSPTSRNMRNLKVLHRHDPTIHTVIDQFSLVTIYELSRATQEWVTIGCEGPLFIFERSREPRLGYIILNRVGLEDYFHYFDASDDFETSDTLLICRLIRPPAPKRIIGMWTEGGEGDSNPMKRMQEVMTGINQCLKQDLPYIPSQASSDSLAHHNNSQISESEAMSNLLSKLGATSTSTQLSPHVQQQISRNNSFPTSGETTPLAHKSALAPPLSGASLLSSIFASAVPAPPAANEPPHQNKPPNPTPPPPPPILSEQNHIEPHSPRPQILTPSIIDAIMGVSPSRASNSTESDSTGGMGLGLGLTSILKRGYEHERGGLTPTPVASSTPFEGKNGAVPNGFSSHDGRRSQPMNTSTPPRSGAKGRPESKHKKPPPEPKGRTLVPFQDDSELWPYSRSPNGKSVLIAKGKNGEESYDADADAEDQLSTGNQESFRLDSSISKTPDREKGNNRRRREPMPIWDEVVSNPNNLPVQSSPSPGPPFGIGPSGQRTKRREKVKKQYIPHNSPPPAPTNVASLPKGRDMGKAQLQQILASSFLTSAAKSSCDEVSHPNSVSAPAATSAPVRVPESKNEFVRELLGLIHTDKHFVEELWEKYRGLSIGR